MSKNTLYPTMFMTAALLVSALLTVPNALAVTFTVNSTLDQPDDLTIPGTCHTAANTCTLRAAIMQANRTSGAGATISVPAGIYTLTIPAAGAFSEENGDLNLTSPTIGSPVIAIIGAGASTTIIDGNGLDRVFQIGLGRTASITGVTIKNGHTTPSENGGGIKNLGTLTVTNCEIRDNFGNPGGGGIYNNGVMTVTNSKIFNNKNYQAGAGIENGLTGRLTILSSTVSDNQAGSGGGGIFNNRGTLVIKNTTISGNRGGAYQSGIGDGGGIYTYSGLLSIENCTISGNQAYNGGGIQNNGLLAVTNTTISQNIALGDGGGIYNYIGGQANVYNSTITQNQSDYDRDPNGGIGGGVYNYTGGTFNLRNTLVAGNYTQDAPVPDECWGTLNSFGWNLFGVGDGFLNQTVCTIVNGGGSWDIFSGALGPLQNNGGPTWTHALLPGSNNAIDHSDLAQGCIGPDGLPLAIDQRGAARVVGLRCDIGAFEYGAKVSQSIQFGPISHKSLADSPFVITATSSSDLPVDFSTNTPSVCTVTIGPVTANVSSATVVLNGGGTCTLVAQQPGNQIFDPAITVTQAFNVTGSKTFLPLILS